MRASPSTRPSRLRLLFFFRLDERFFSSPSVSPFFDRATSSRVMLVNSLAQAKAQTKK